MDEKTLVASISPMVQLTLIQLQNEAFTKQATEAVTAFLQQPKSFTITAKPATTLKVGTSWRWTPISRARRSPSWG